MLGRPKGRVVDDGERLDGRLEADHRGANRMPTGERDLGHLWRGTVGVTTR
jgi:hypothetical protein